MSAKLHFVSSFDIRILPEHDFSFRHYICYSSTKHNPFAFIAAILIQRRYRELSEDHTYLKSILYRGAEAARAKSKAVLKNVHDALGFVIQG